MKRLSLYIILATSLFHPLIAQQEVVRPLDNRETSPLSMDLLLYTDATRYYMSGIGTAGIPYLSSPIKREMYEVCGDLGFRSDIYHIGQIFHTSFFVGLRYGHLYYKDERNINAGVHALWINAGIEERLSYFIAGIRSDLFLNSYTRSYDNYTYLGIPPKCFSPIDANYYFGGCIQTEVFRFDMKIVFYLIPQINPTRLAYYNLEYSNISSWYFEIGLSYRIFTLSKHLTIGKTSFLN